MSCKILSDICQAFPEKPANKTLFALKGAVDDLIATEQRSIEKMAPHVDKVMSKLNYKMAQLAKEHLEMAAEALVDGDMKEASYQLLLVAENREEETDV